MGRLFFSILANLLVNNKFVLIVPIVGLIIMLWWLAHNLAHFWFRFYFWCICICNPVDLLVSQFFSFHVALPENYHNVGEILLHWYYVDSMAQHFLILFSVCQNRFGFFWIHLCRLLTQLFETTLEELQIFVDFLSNFFYS